LIPARLTHSWPDCSFSDQPIDLAVRMNSTQSPAQRALSSFVLLSSLLGASVAIAAPPACPTVAVYRPGVFSSEAHYEWRLSFTPSRKTAYWHISDDFLPTIPQGVIVTSTLGPKGWSRARTASFSGKYADNDAYVSPDGSTFLFSSMRPVDGVARKDFDLWMMRRTVDGWSEPMHLAGAVNSGKEELYPSMDRQGNLYFGSDRDGGFDVWRSRRQRDGSFAAPEKLGSGVNTKDFWEFNPEISPDGKTLLFVGLNRPDGIGWGDIYVSRLRDGEFTPARDLGPCVNTGKDDFHPTVLWRENKLVFVRNPDEPGKKSDFLITELRLPPE